MDALWQPINLLLASPVGSAPLQSQWGGVAELLAAHGGAAGDPQLSLRCSVAPVARGVGALKTTNGPFLTSGGSLAVLIFKS